MYCRTCGAEMNENQVICLGCGCSAGAGNAHCANCGAQLAPNAAVCMNCGVSADFGSASKAKASNTGVPGIDNASWCPPDKDKLIAILLAFFIGGIGIHNFYLGETKKGIFKLLTCWLFIGGILALVDFIKMLTGSYVVDPDKLI